LDESFDLGPWTGGPGAPARAEESGAAPAPVRPAAGEPPIAGGVDALLEQERWRVLGDLASGVAHDLNNTLHALSLRLERLRKSRAVMAEQRENLEVIERIVADASARVKRFEEIGRRREDRPDGTVDLARAVAEALGVAKLEMGSEERVRVEVLLPPLGTVLADPEELHQVFVGLFLNARDAMRGSGRLRVEGRKRGDWAVITVADDGPGIREDHLRRIFDPFFTTKGRRASGLGLAVAGGVMRRLGGRIEAGNGPGGGAVFTLSFPRLSPQALVRRAAAARPPARRAAPVRVLVVDDDEDNLEASRWILEEMGHHAEVTPSGADAIGRVEAGERYDLVLCDLGMPGVDGWTVARRLRELAPATTVYLVTGWAQEVGREDPRRETVAGVLPKPLDLGALERILAAAGQPGRA
jgi:CheY-like chemotaxis protein